MNNVMTVDMHEAVVRGLMTEIHREFVSHAAERPTWSSEDLLALLESSMMSAALTVNAILTKEASACSTH